MLIEKEKCTGCGACLQACPKQSIEWQQGDFGFKYPKINEEKCIKCGLCEKVCPANKKMSKPEIQKAYSLISTDRAILQSSTSGGAFSTIANAILAKGGIVYGCSMEKSFQVQHIRITQKSELAKLRGSKYVQSNTRLTFQQAKHDLDNDQMVLFSGTPCQIAGLYSFLGKEYSKLMTVDIICHGVGSQAYFDKFVDNLKKKTPGLERIEFRNKKYVGWACGGLLKAKGKLIPFYNHTHYYYSYFLSGEIYRDSCYSCSYANISRVGDITLGDFWGAESLKIDQDVTGGCSLVIANSNKGVALVKSLSTLTMLNSVDLQLAIRNNAQLSHPSKKPESRKTRLKEFNTLSGEQIQRIYVKTHKKRIIKGKIKVLIPYKLKVKMRKIIN